MYLLSICVHVDLCILINSLTFLYQVSKNSTSTVYTFRNKLIDGKQLYEFLLFSIEINGKLAWKCATYKYF